jgi:hypothetical protein
MSVGWNMWLDKMLLFLRLIAKMGDLILEGGINIKFYAKLWKKASYNCAVPSDDYGREAMKSQSVFDCRKRLNVDARTWKMMKEVVVQNLIQPMQMFKNAESGTFRWSTKLNMWKHWSSCVKLRLQKGLDSVQALNSPPWQCSSSQGALCQAVYGPKIYYWNGTPTLIFFFVSKWIVALSKNKVCRRVKKILQRWKHQ